MSPPTPGTFISSSRYGSRTNRRQRSTNAAKMLCTLSTLTKRANLSPANTRSPAKLYFAPGGHSHDRHTIPPDRLHISLSDPVLVAAEQRLSGASQRSDNDNDGILTREAVNWHLTIATNTQETKSGHSLKAEPQGTTACNLNSPDSSDDSYNITEVMSKSFIDVPLDNADNSPFENSRYGPALAPLASETFREELYVRGYLKRPASRSQNVVFQKSRTGFTFMTHKVFPKVLGRRQGRKVAETLRAEEDAARIPDRLHAHIADKRLSIIASVTLRTPHADGLESPGMNTITSASESFDLHEFSYITAFTTPPSSPSIVLDVETRTGICVADSRFAT